VLCGVNMNLEKNVQHEYGRRANSVFSFKFDSNSK